MFNNSLEDNLIEDGSGNTVQTILCLMDTASTNSFLEITVYNSTELEVRYTIQGTDVFHCQTTGNKIPQNQWNFISLRSQAGRVIPVVNNVNQTVSGTSLTVLAGTQAGNGTGTHIKIGAVTTSPANGLHCTHMCLGGFRLVKTYPDDPQTYSQQFNGYVSNLIIHNRYLAGNEIDSFYTRVYANAVFLMAGQSNMAGNSSWGGALQDEDMDYTLHEGRVSTFNMNDNIEITAGNSSRYNNKCRASYWINRC